jgi:hypothetical protein
MQAIQVQDARRLVPPGSEAPAGGDPVRLLAFAAGFPPLKRTLGRIVVLGFRRERIRSPEA